eukprot:scaffold184129_cov27-Tisochrysis_lutea.AAC.1
MEMPRTQPHPKHWLSSFMPAPLCRHTATWSQLCARMASRTQEHAYTFISNQTTSKTVPDACA